MTIECKICYNLLRKLLLQNCKVHSQHSSELLIRGVVFEVHVAGGIYLLLCTKLCCSLRG